MKLVITLCFTSLLWQYQLFAQATVKKEYVDRNFYQVKRKEEAKYFRVATVDENHKLNGIVEYYYLNNDSYARNLYAKGAYENNARTGKWEWWYVNGSPLEVGFFEKKSTIDEEKNVLKPESLNYTYRIESYWDSSGVQQVSNGNGTAQYTDNGITLGKGTFQNGLKQGKWEGTYQVPDTDESIRFEEEYNKGQLISGVSYDKTGKNYTYDILEILPEPKGGLKGLMKYLMKTLRYPSQARSKGIEGRVVVQFYVEKDGSLSDIELLQSIGGGCDEEAIRVVKECPKWIGGIHRGQQVKVKMSLPIVFKQG